MSILEFEKEIGNDFTIVDFSATWCGPCRMLSKVLDSISSEYKIVKIDIDKEEELARINGINVVPTIKLYKNGSELATKSGFMDKTELLRWIERYK